MKSCIAHEYDVEEMMRVNTSTMRQQIGHSRWAAFVKTVYITDY